ncbi:macro domain-containing protein [Listeria booriae]|uniref:macro domain-containing protein n=1 Tax=Listeria booriae TaxID=1552123 RepID=UPI001C8A21B3|nr:macro domain-containing protein [Listeria booriae]
MIIKVKFFDKRVKEKFLKYIGAFGTAISFILIFYELPDNKKIMSSIIFAISLIVIYFFIWIHANRIAHTSLIIGGTTVQIKKGDIFDEQGLKVIPFNEYFDTQVDDRIIAKASLNGKYIETIYGDADKLAEAIKENTDLNIPENIASKEICREGNGTKYHLGSLIVIDDFVLTAFSKFSERNEAELTMTEYINFLLRFWNEINRVYAQKSVTVPVFGSDLTRFKNGFEEIDVDELLNIMLWTFRISKTKFKFPAKLTIIIYGELFDKINLFNLQEDVD